MKIKETENGTTASVEGSAFGRVLAAIMTVRAIPVDAEHVRELGEKGGLDPEAFLARATGETVEFVGGMGGVVEALGLSRAEVNRLVHAYAFEQESE